MEEAEVVMVEMRAGSERLKREGDRRKLWRMVDEQKNQGRKR